MFQVFGAEIFLKHIRERRVCLLTGNYGTGKSLLSVMMSYMFVRERIVDHVVGTMPIAWSIPAAVCPLLNYMIIFDEVGVSFDARSFGKADQNTFRKLVLAFPRKLNIYLVMGSRLSPDASFRSLSCQHVWGPLFGFDCYAWSLEDGEVSAAGQFYTRGLDSFYREGLKDGKKLTYHHSYIPSEPRQLVSLLLRSIASAQDENQEDPNDWGEEHDQTFREFYRTTGRELVDRLSTDAIYSAGGRTVPDVSSGHQSQISESGGQLLVGVGSETIRSGKRDYRI